MANTKKKVIEYSFGNTLLASLGGGVAAGAWFGMDFINALDDKPVVAPLVTWALGIGLGGIKPISAGAQGMQGASTAQLTTMLIQKIRANRAAADEEGKRTIGDPVELNGMLNEALQNPQFKAKFQDLMRNNPAFREAIIRRMDSDTEANMKNVVNQNAQMASDVFTLALQEKA